MKILFIYPNAGSQIGFNYGVSHLSAVLKNAGHKVELLQLCDELEPLPSDEQFSGIIKESAADIIAFSVVTNQWQYTEKLAKLAREAAPAAKLVCGGVHATVATEDTVKSALFDYVFIGESEDAFLEFVEKLSRGESVAEVRNLAYLKNGQVISNPVRPLPELDKLPFKDYEIFDFQKLIDAKNGWVGLMASRGCPFSCTYCFNHKMVKKYRTDLKCSFKELNYIRHFPVKEVIKEIKFLLERYKNIKMFIFDDDLFTFDTDYLVHFCEEYKKVSSLPFVVNAHVGFFDEIRAKALAEANCSIVKFGLESGSEKIRSKIMNRHMSNESISKAIQTVNQYGMHSSVFVMIGLPFETKDDLMQTIKLVADSQPGRFRWTYFFPYPGTESHRIAVEAGFVDFEKMTKLVNFTDDSCLDFGAEHNLFLKKVGLAMPWFVNAESNLPCASAYREKVNWLLGLDAQKLEEIAPQIRTEDKKISEEMQNLRIPHYAIKYNRFMGVISDYFLNEK